MKRKVIVYLFSLLVVQLAIGIDNNSDALIIGTQDNSFLKIATNAGGGGNIENAYYELTDYGNALESNSIASHSFSWDNPLYGSGSVFASANFDTGELKVSTEIDTTGGTVSQSNGAYSQATIQDRITINPDFGVDFSNPVTVSYTVDLTGTMTPVVGDPYGLVQVRYDLLQGGFIVSPAEFRTEDFNAIIPESLTNTFDVYSSNNQFDLRFFITTLLSGQEDYGILDFSNTAKISFSLPEGFNLISESGFNYARSGEPTAPVPEPTTVLLLGTGLLGLAGASRKRMKK